MANLRTILGALAVALLLAGCSTPKEQHFLSDPDYRAAVEQALEARLSAHDSALRPFYQLPADVTPEEREALEFLYAYMPLADLTDYPTVFYLENVRASFRARTEMGWNVPEREFRHFVLPLRVNNERLDSARTVFYRELKPRVEGLSMAEAILEVNHWCHEKVTYQPSDARTLSPLACVQNALGRCGEESTFCVAALRSVGIPARQVYTPRWAHTDDNHAWVEAWADGQWHFLGACEPEPVLDLGWFNAPASRAMLMHTKVFGRYDGPEEVVLEAPNYTEVNLIDQYAETAPVTVRVLCGGAPVEGARVDFCIYNYAEFYPALTKYTDPDGLTGIHAGLGDMLIWASHDGCYGFAKVSFGKDSEIEVVLDSPDGTLPLTIVPPPERVRMPEVTPAQRAENDRRFAREDSLRHAYEAGFLSREAALTFVREQGYEDAMADLLVRARGNWETIQAFMPLSGNHERVEEVLSSLSGKDLGDVPLEILQDYYAAPWYLGARVEDEYLWPYMGWFLAQLTAEEREELRDPQRLVDWIRDHIAIEADPKRWRIPMSPMGVWLARVAEPRSRDLFFVALARTLGTEARKEPVTGKIQYRKAGRWLDVDWDGAVAETAPQGTLVLDYVPTKTIDNPKYYSHFSLSRIGDGGRPHLLTFDEGEVDMGGGVDWAHTFRRGCLLDAGPYLLVSGNRCSDGSVPVTLRFFTVREGETTKVALELREPASGVAIIGEFDAETRFSGGSVLSAVGRGFYALAVLDPGKEPTNHILRDLAAARSGLEAWGRPILLLTESEAALERLQAEIADGRYGTLPVTVLLGVDTAGIRARLAANMQLAGVGRLPLVILADSFNRVFFCSEGYTIGLGDRLLDTARRL